MLLEVNKQLTERIVELTREVVKVQAPPQQIPMEQSLMPLHTPETEEDANFLLANGVIDKGEYETILKELQFYNDEIVVPAQ